LSQTTVEAAGVEETVGLKESDFPLGMRLALLEGFELQCQGQVIDLAGGVQKLFAFLALHERPVRRSYVAGNLWSDVSEERASGNLRSTLWRIVPPARNLVVANGNLLSLAPALKVDLKLAVSVAHSLIDAEQVQNDVMETSPEDSLLSSELLPDWYDEWVIPIRERLRQLRLHALDALCVRLTAATRFGQAIDAALLAISAEPLRESSHRALIRAHLAEGNRCEAIRQYNVFRELMRLEMDLPPSPMMEQVRREIEAGGDI
jgi:DNA-binding SARP family transcriptional activator